MRIKWHGHASFELEDSRDVVHVDPREFRGETKKADLILITHAHESHFDLKAINHVSKDDTLLVGPPKSLDKEIEHKFIQVVSPGDFLEHRGVSVHVVPAFHPEGDYHSEGDGVGYILEMDGKRIYHAGDTGIHHNMHFFDDIDIALIPIGGLYNLTMHEAVEATRLINPEIVIPMHYGYMDYYPADPYRFKELAEEATHSKVEILENNILYI
ncbi:MAG: MBL fold metallo-hydrolase [Candidatus Altiarchaeota archaeon]